MDLVISRINIKGALFVLTERKTKLTLLSLLKNKEAKNVVDVFNKLESNLGLENFKKIFKTITTDNGVEFKNVSGMESSILNQNEKRTNVYFARTYKSLDKGCVENVNRLIHIKFPKGTNFEKINQNQLEDLWKYVNEYPRKSFDFKNALFMYNKFNIDKNILGLSENNDKFLLQTIIAN